MVLTRLETKLDTATIGIADHESRIRTVEQSAVTERDIAQLRSDVESLKRSRWPLPTIGAIGGVVGAVAAIYAMAHP
ncbi:hypothetical protein ACFC1T_14475 [Kitasatospora sp. NPDC056076]|uniref:hypothetical protein n=1 Tax=Kitasatospora sp. NPDC056076 TaxID=3345703 RepID=UPI0035DEBB7B